MVHYRRSSDPIVGDRLKSRAGLTLSILALFLALLLGMLLVSGFWSAKSAHADATPPGQPASPAAPA